MYLFQRLIAINEESLYKMCYYSVKMRISAPLLRFKQSWAKKVWNWCSGKHLASGSASLILLGMKVGVVASSKKKKTSSLVLHLTCRNPLGSFSLMTSRQYSISPVVWRSFTVQCEIWSRTTWREKNINKRGRKEGEERRNSNEGLQFCKYNALIQQAYWG